MQTIIRSRRHGVTIRYTVEDDPTLGTLGSHQLLLEQYRLLEKSPRFEQLLFNSYFLRKMKSTYKKLHCVYCGRKNLRIYHWNEFAGRKYDMATADHFIPKSVNPTVAMDVENLRVACHHCNSKKGSYYWDEKFPYPEIENLWQKERLLVSTKSLTIRQEKENECQSKETDKLPSGF
jgi:5-methylcytosine-specific restriction endonuclease McrA